MQQNVEVNERLKKGCVDAHQAFQKIDDKKYADIQSKLEWVIKSYENDKNPAGLHEIGSKALKQLKDYKAKNPRKVNKKSIDSLEKSLSQYEKNQSQK